MTAPSLSEMLDVAGAHARTVLIDKQTESMLPIFDLRDAEGNGYIVAGEFTGDTRDEEVACKDAFAALVRKLIIQHKIIQYSFMTEAWMIVRTKYTEGISTPPVDCADRIEVVIATAQSGTEYQMRRWLLQRDASGKAVDLVPDPPLEGETPTPSGRFDNLLDGQ